MIQIDNISKIAVNYIKLDLIKCKQKQFRAKRQFRYKFRRSYNISFLHIQNYVNEIKKQKICFS